jgi:pimeloyl-ACP methyl ester carboxylesterase
MPRLPRPDAVELHWEARGAGPPVLIAPHWAGHPRLTEPLEDDLAREHRVVHYHPRGTGKSTRRGPYSLSVDAADLAAVVQAAAPGAVVVGNADASHRAILAAAEPGCEVAAVLTHNDFLRGLAPSDSSDALAESPAVLRALLQLAETGFRAAVHSLMASTNPDFEEEEVQRRVEEVIAFTTQDAAVGRLRAWIEDRSAPGAAAALGDRLWWLVTPTNPWFPQDLAPRMRELLPHAHVEILEEGPFNRPELTADVVRRITAGQRGAARPAGGSGAAPGGG